MAEKTIDELLEEVDKHLDNISARSRKMGIIIARKKTLGKTYYKGEVVNGKVVFSRSSSNRRGRPGAR